MGSMIALDTFDPETTILAWAARMNVAPDDIEEAVWVVGFDELAVRHYFATRRRVFVPESEPLQAALQSSGNMRTASAKSNQPLSQA